MSTRPRPDDCCHHATPVAELAVAERERVVAGFKALGDGTRLEIFRLIAAQVSPVCVCDITEGFKVSQPTISHHLKVLREAGLITVARQGVWAFYAATARGKGLLSVAVDSSMGQVADAA